MPLLVGFLTAATTATVTTTAAAGNGRSFPRSPRVFRGKRVEDLSHFNKGEVPPPDGFGFSAGASAGSFTSSALLLDSCAKTIGVAQKVVGLDRTRVDTIQKQNEFGFSNLEFSNVKV